MGHRKALAELSSAWSARHGGRPCFPDLPPIGNRVVTENTGSVFPRLCNNAQQFYTTHTCSRTRAHTHLQKGNFLQTVF